MSLVAQINQMLPPFAKLLGIEVTEADPDHVIATMTVRNDLCTRPEILHGGAVMSFADNLGALLTVINLPEGTTTTTSESKTNFFRPSPVGTVVTGEATLIHKGRRTMVLQSRIMTEEGKLAALITQTQMVLSAD